ncbi:MAG: ATP-dependent zinc metalloprotease FtsH, partial [Eubacteriales bacterium]|nr:ATP-dependent zinc metalloprotease FtsH [Eubacteriales bacterium]
MKKTSIFQTIFIYVLIGFFILAGLTIYKNYTSSKEDIQKAYTYNELVNDIKSNNISHIKSITIKPTENNSGFATIDFNDQKKEKEILPIPSISSFMDIVHSNLKDADIIKTKPVDNTSNIYSLVIPLIAIVVVVITIIVFLVLIAKQGKNVSDKASSFGKNKAKLIIGSHTKVTFKDVAGLKEEKSDLEEIVEFLKSPKKFEEIGARIPKGILLIGSPGTGKTLLARAIAGEANVKFFSISGSDFVEMFVGVGASRVRDLFEEAKANKPALIFIDEIDAVGRRRGSGLGGGHDEREQTLNQLLVEMDGFTKNEGLIILAATNRPDILDPALLRPGRFDRQIVVSAPDVKGREDILNVHLKNKKLDESVEVKEIAKMTSGFTGAELENLLNEAALLAARKNEKNIKMEHIRKAFIKVGVGTERKSRVISQEEKKITAYHEAGHAILFEMLNLLDSVHIVSIIPTGMAGGYTMPLPVDKGYLSKKYLEQNIMSFFGGRIAEDIIFNDVTTGASNDIERATQIAYSMVADYGMSSLGPVKFNPKSNSQELSSLVDKEVEKIISNSYEKAKKIITDNIDILHSCANLLLEKEKISGDEFRALFPENYLPEKIKPTIIEFNDDDTSED